jgi:hypothetical protein
MENVSTQDVVKHTILRLIVVVCSTAGFGFLFFRLSVFDMRMWASQFLTSGVTAAIFYAALKTPRWRDGFAALLIWYLVLTFLVAKYNSWLPILHFAYVAGIAAAVYLYTYFVRREIVRGLVQRVAAAGVITAVVNAVIIVFLGLFSWRTVFASPGYIASWVFKNLQIGTLIGIGFGTGVEIAEYIIRRFAGGGESESGLARESGSAGVHHGSTSMHRGTIAVTCASCGEDLELTPAEVSAGAYTCPSCGKPGTL